jgi:hypothetical protein
MNWIPGSSRRRKLIDDLSEEMRLHLEERVEHLIGEGLSQQDAQRQARVAFGNLATIEERSREVWQWPTLESIWADIRFAFRQLRKSPGFAFATVATLALAIGANTVVFAVFNALVLRPLNLPAAENIYIVGHAQSMWGYESYPNYRDLRDRNRTFDGLAADNISQAGFDTGRNPSRAWLIEATGNYFDVLGVQPYLGRFFHAADEHGPNSAPYIVLSYAGWRDRFQGDRGVVGRTVLLNKHPFVIIGVAPPGFVGTFIAFSPDLFVPIVNCGLVDGDDAVLNQRANRWMSEVVGRLKQGGTAAQADGDLDSIGSGLGKSYPNDEDQALLTFKLQRPGVASAFGGAVKTFLAGLMLMAGLILLAACANLGSLFAARAADRSREVALRLALGARRIRILRQLLTEAILLSLVGGAAGLWGSVVLLRAIGAWRPFPEFPMNLPLNPDANVYALELLDELLDGASCEHYGDLASLLPELFAGEIPLHQRQAQAVETFAVCLQAIACGDAAEGRKAFTAALSQQRYISGGSSSLGASRTGIVPDDDLLAASATACARLCDSSHFRCLATSRSALLGGLLSSRRSSASRLV